MDRGIGSLVVSDAVAPLTLAAEGHVVGNLAHGLVSYARPPSCSIFSQSCGGTGWCWCNADRASDRPYPIAFPLSRRMEAMIETVLGPIAPDALGVCLPHEHIWCDQRLAPRPELFGATR